MFLSHMKCGNIYLYVNHDIMSKEMREHIDKFKTFFINESKDEEEVVKRKEDIKSLLFQILNKSEYVQEFNYVWSPNLVVGAEPIFLNFSEKDFFDTNKSVFETIGDGWPYGKENYDEWKKLYYGLVMGYKIKDKNSEFSILVQIIRYEKSILSEIGTDEFRFYVNPGYIGSVGSKKIFINDKILNVIGSDEENYEDRLNDFTELGEKLQTNVKTIQDCKLLFRYLDALT
jgi:hypothetical protein